MAETITSKEQAAMRRLPAEEKRKIARKLGCSKAYVDAIIRTDNTASSFLAQKVVLALRKAVTKHTTTPDDNG